MPPSLWLSCFWSSMLDFSMFIGQWTQSYSYWLVLVYWRAVCYILFCCCLFEVKYVQIFKVEMKCFFSNWLTFKSVLRNWNLGLGKAGCLKLQKRYLCVIKLMLRNRQTDNQIERQNSLWPEQYIKFWWMKVYPVYVNSVSGSTFPEFNDNPR